MTAHSMPTYVFNKYSKTCMCIENTLVLAKYVLILLKRPGFNVNDYIAFGTINKCQDYTGTGVPIFKCPD